MFIEMKKVPVTYTRPSKLGLVHEYTKFRTVAVLRCDNCSTIFERPLAKTCARRLTNAYFHVCKVCDSKKFAQRKGVERRTIWNRPASSQDDISKL